MEKTKFEMNLSDTDRESAPAQVPASCTVEDNSVTLEADGAKIVLEPGQWIKLIEELCYILEQS